MSYYQAGGVTTIPSHTPSGGKPLTDVPDADDVRPAYRRMNPGNVRALRRAMRRVQSFAKLARGTIQFTQRVKMKRRRRRA